MQIHSRSNQIQCKCLAWYKGLLYLLRKTQCQLCSFFSETSFSLIVTTDEQKKNNKLYSIDTSGKSLSDVCPSLILTFASDSNSTAGRTSRKCFKRYQTNQSHCTDEILLHNTVKALAKHFKIIIQYLYHFITLLLTVCIIQVEN